MFYGLLDPVSSSTNISCKIHNIT